MAVLDLTLDGIMIPGLPTFTPIFGTKKADNVGLSTGEVNTNVLFPWTRQRPYTIAEISSTGIVESNACIVLDSGCTALTLGDGDFTGVRVLLINKTALAVQLITSAETGYILPYETIEVMWYGDCWYVCDGKKVGEIINVTFPLTVMPFGYLSLHSGLRPSRTAYARLAAVLLNGLADVTFTCTTATPTVCTVSGGHGFTGGERLRLFTTGALTGATLTNDYFVEYINSTTFYLITTEGGTARLAITGQSGTHHYQCSAYGVGDGSTTMDLPDPRQSAFVGAGLTSTHPAASVDKFLLGQWKDDQAQVIEGEAENMISAGATGVTGVMKKTLASTSAAAGTARAYVTLGIDTALTNRTGLVNRNKDIGTNYIIKY